MSRVIRRLVFATMVCGCSKTVVPPMEIVQAGAATHRSYPPADKERSDDVQLSSDVPVRWDALPWRMDAQRVREAQGHLKQNEPNVAIERLDGATSPAAALVRARALRQLGRFEQARESLNAAQVSSPGSSSLVPLVTAERALLWAKQGEVAQALELLLPLLRAGDMVALAGTQETLHALLSQAPERFLENVQFLEKLLDPEDLDARSRLLATQADMLRLVNRSEAADQVELRRYLEEPVSTLTPLQPPAQLRPTSEQLLQRAEVLLEAHRNERVLEAMGAIEEQGLTAEQRCRRRFGMGLAHRKLHHYADADRDFGWVEERCQDEDLCDAPCICAPRSCRSIRGWRRCRISKPSQSGLPPIRWLMMCCFGEVTFINAENVTRRRPHSTIAS
ncbi:MAG: hypothetical protein R3C68_10225 [Myxococcota bacterium]